MSAYAFSGIIIIGNVSAFTNVFTALHLCKAVLAMSEMFVRLFRTENVLGLGGLRHFLSCDFLIVINTN